MRTVQSVAVVVWLSSSSSASAVDVVEALGGEKCRAAVKSYALEFLAPEDAQVEARAKVMREGREDVRSTPALSVDGKPCVDGRCAFRATKGQTYKLAAESATPGIESLCISVARP
jgi:hypothetical protein